MFLVPLILQMFGKKQIKVNFSREELAQHVRAGRLKITCHECACRMMPNAADWIECTGCGKVMTVGDSMETLREIRPRKAPRL
ncbi:MAG: hypothetical protein WCC54_07025 [Pseudolabrys sp.]